MKVAKLDKSRLNTEQSAYIPNIPDIAKCPEHLLPLKQWEDVFLAEFSALREVCSSQTYFCMPFFFFLLYFHLNDQHSVRVMLFLHHIMHITCFAILITASWTHIILIRRVVESFKFVHVDVLANKVLVWEHTDFSLFPNLLFQNLSCLEGSSAMLSGNLQSVHSSKLPGNNFGESANVVNSDVLLYDQPTILTAEDEEKALPLENPGSKTSIDQTSSSCPTPPLLSAVLGMDPVARVSMLLKRISLLEPADTITRNDCMWLFALCATVDAPLDADTCAALRSLLRKCASLRAGKAELDEEVVMLNILATISGRYFGQSEN